MWRKYLTTFTLSSLATFSVPSIVSAATLDISITNLTQGIYFTPLIVAAHGEVSDVFEPGVAASSSLQQLAEGGDISGVANDLNGVSVVEENPAGGLLAPGESTSVVNMDTLNYDRLSIAAMILPTNDGFVGLDSWVIPSTPGTYTIYLNAYDAGTEANDERLTPGSGAPGVLGIPADPGGANGVGASGLVFTETNTTVHIHRGNIGDDNASGGESDLDNSVHRWLNPVAKVVITVE